MSWTPPSMIPASRLGLNLAPVFGWRGSYAEDRWLGTSRELCRLCLCLAAYLSALPGGSSPGLLPTWSSAFPLLCARLTRLMTLCPALCLTGWRPAPAAPSPTFHLRPLALLLGPDTPQPKEPFLPAAAQVANRPSAHGTSPCWHATSRKHPQMPTPLCLVAQGLLDLRSCLLPSQIPCCTQAGDPMACPAPGSPWPCSPHITPSLQLVWELPPRPLAFPITAHSHEPPPPTGTQTSG